MATVDKALGFLTLFTPDEPQWTVDAAASRLGVPISTAYRYFRSLTDAGLLVDFAAGRYVIGPGIIELDRLARRTDPLILAAQQPMDDLMAIAIPNVTVLLARLYRRRVMCVDQRPHGHGLMDLSFERGRPMPLYRGSVSKVILAYLPARTLSRLYQEDHREIADAGLGADMPALRKRLRSIRRDGYFVSRGEVDRGVSGIAAPVFAPEGDAFASLTVVIPERCATGALLPTLIASVTEAAARTSEALRVLGNTQAVTGELGRGADDAGGDASRPGARSAVTA